MMQLILSLRVRPCYPGITLYPCFVTLVQCSILSGTQAAVGTSDLLQDIASAPGPDGRLGVGVVMYDVLIDGSDEFGYADDHT